MNVIGRSETPDIFGQIIPGGDGICAGAVFQGPLLFRGIELPEIVDAGIGGRTRATARRMAFNPYRDQGGDNDDANRFDHPVF